MPTVSGGVILAMTPDILTPFADADLSYEFGPDDGLETYRDGNGALALADPPAGLASRQKFRLAISSAQQINALALDGIWVGDSFVIDVAVQMHSWLADGDTEVTLDRDPVPGSVEALTKDGAALTVTDVTSRTVTVASHSGQAAYVGFFPRLTMLLDQPWRATFRRNAWEMANSLVFREV